MTNIEHVGSDPLTERELFLLDLQKPEDLSNDFSMPSAHFACMIAWDSEFATVEQISDLVEPLIKYGGAYFCTWGSGCKRVHDIIDEIDSYTSNDSGSPEDSVIMTTWHDNEPLDEVIEFFLNLTDPHPYYEETLKSSIAISIGSAEWFSIIRNALKNPMKFRNDIENK